MATTATMSRYGDYRTKCSLLERELVAIRARLPADQHDATIEYLLDVAQATMAAARVLTEARLESVPPAVQP